MSPAKITFTILGIGVIAYGIWFGLSSFKTGLPDQEGLPVAVELKRQEIYRAAKKQQYSAFDPLVDQDAFKYSFGENIPGGFAEYLESVDARSGRSSFATIQAILALPYEKQHGMYVWPGFFVRSADAWTEHDLQSLGTIATPDEISDYQSYGAYIGWRLGIREDGTWAYYVAGD